MARAVTHGTVRARHNDEAMKRAVAVSPHLDNAVLACGATLAGLAAGGWELTLVTVFAGGAALAARREDDRVAAERLGVGAVVHLPLEHADAARVAAQLGPALDAARPERIFAPLGLTGDRTAIDALAWLGHPAPIVRWRDGPAGRPLPDERGIPVAAQLERKLDACAAYGHQVAAHGGEEHLRTALRAFHAAEGRRLGVDGPAEALLEPPPDRRRRRPGGEADDKAALVRALRGVRR
jgi:LmbE family N-acetylglucosaminyl deacetylase